MGDAIEPLLDPVQPPLEGKDEFLRPIPFTGDDPETADNGKELGKAGGIECDHIETFPLKLPDRDQGFSATRSLDDEVRLQSQDHFHIGPQVGPDRWFREEGWGEDICFGTPHQSILKPHGGQYFVVGPVEGNDSHGRSVQPDILSEVVNDFDLPGDSSSVTRQANAQQGQQGQAQSGLGDIR